MAIDPITGATALVSLASGKKQQRAQEKQARDAATIQRDLIERTNEIDKLLKMAVDEFDRTGGFDAEAQIRQLEADAQRYQALDRDALAGSYKIAGYKPGDTVIERGIQANDTRYRRDLDQMRVALRRQNLFDKIGAYKGITPNSNVANIAQGQQAMALGSMSSPAGFFQSVMPFLNPSQQRKQPGNRSGGGPQSQVGLSASPQIPEWLKNFRVRLGR